MEGLKNALQQRLKEVGFKMDSGSLQTPMNKEKVKEYFEAYGVLSVEKEKNQVDSDKITSDGTLENVSLNQLKDKVYV